MAGLTFASVIGVLSFDFFLGLPAGGGTAVAVSSLNPGGVEGSDAVVTCGGAGPGVFVAASTGVEGAGMLGNGGATFGVLWPSGVVAGAGVTVLAICVGDVP